MDRRAFLKLAAAGAGALAAGGPRLAAAAGSDDEWLDDLAHRSFRYFWEQSDPGTGIVRGRARFDGSPYPAERRDVGSTGDTGFGLTALCIGADRGWVGREQARERVRATLRAYAEGPVANVHGWFYHWINAKTGERTGATYDIAQFGRRPGAAASGGEEPRRIRSEVSVSDSTWLVAGALTARQYFREDPDIGRWARTIYERVDYRWMCGAPSGLSRPEAPLLHMSWAPESGFSSSRYQRFDQLLCMYLLGIAAPDPERALPAASWYGWDRNPNRYGAYAYVGTSNLWTYQYPLAWFDLRGRREARGSRLDYFQNAAVATRANRAFCIDLGRTQFPGCYSSNVWGITSSLSRRGYKAWGGPPAHGGIDGTVVPCAPAGSAMFTPDICLPALRTMRERFGSKAYGRYGFADAFQPVLGWVAEDVIALDVGITLLAIENLRSGSIWRWFMSNPEAARALELAELEPEAA